jgi:uncharacterized protein
VSGHTVSKYRDLLTELLLVPQLTPWTGNVSKRLVKSPKVLIRDSGLCHTLIGFGDHEALLGHPFAGGSCDGFVVENLLQAVPDLTLTFLYLSAVGHEIDLVLERGSRRVAIKRKLSSAPILDEGFFWACETIGVDTACVVYAGDTRYPMQNGVQAIGLRDLMVELSQQRQIYTYSPKPPLPEG